MCKIEMMKIKPNAHPQLFLKFYICNIFRKFGCVVYAKRKHVYNITIHAHLIDESTLKWVRLAGQRIDWIATQ